MEQALGFWWTKTYFAKLCGDRYKSFLELADHWWILEFLQELVITQTIGGLIQINTDWPSYLHNKGVFFVKKEQASLPEYSKSILDYIVCGDVHENVIGIE